MKGVYYSEGLNFNDVANTGITKKVRRQIECLQSIGGLTVINVVFPKTLKEKTKFLLPIMMSDREKGGLELLKAVDKKTDYIYIRKPSLTIKFYKFLKRIKQINPNIFIMLEIPTYPFHSEYSGLSKLNVLKSVHCEKKLKKVIDKIVTYSDDDIIWGIPTIKMSNCVSYDEISMRSGSYKLRPGVIRLTCAARFMYWHGLDRLIKGIKEYDGDCKIVLNVVGGGREIDNLKKLAIGMDNIIFHGPKNGLDLDKIFDETDIAVDALGRHRSGVYYNSSLKGKEYAARGIPSISAVRTELDTMSDYAYYLKLPADESSIDVERVIAFYDKIYKTKSASAVTKEIRKRTILLFDYENGFKKVISKELGGICKGKE